MVRSCRTAGLSTAVGSSAEQIKVSDAERRVEGCSRAWVLVQHAPLQLPIVRPT